MGTTKKYFQQKEKLMYLQKKNIISETSMIVSDFMSLAHHFVGEFIFIGTMDWNDLWSG